MGVREERKVATRVKLVATARRQFTLLGYEGVKVRELAHAMGMSTGVVFAHFHGGKDELWEAAMGCPAPSIRQTKEAIEETIRSAIKSPDHNVPRAALLQIAQQMSDLTRGLYGWNAA